MPEWTFQSRAINSLQSAQCLLMCYKLFNDWPIFRSVRGVGGALEQKTMTLQSQEKFSIKTSRLKSKVTVPRLALCSESVGDGLAGTVGRSNSRLPNQRLSPIHKGGGGKDHIHIWWLLIWLHRTECYCYFYSQEFLRYFMSKCQGQNNKGIIFWKKKQQISQNLYLLFCQMIQFYFYS